MTKKEKRDQLIKKMRKNLEKLEDEIWMINLNKKMRELEEVLREVKQNISPNSDIELKHYFKKPINQIRFVRRNLHLVHKEALINELNKRYIGKEDKSSNTDATYMKIYFDKDITLHERFKYALEYVTFTKLRLKELLSVISSTELRNQIFSGLHDIHGAIFNIFDHFMKQHKQHNKLATIRTIAETALESKSDKLIFINKILEELKK